MSKPVLAVLACLCSAPCLGATAETIAIAGGAPVQVHGPIGAAREIIAAEEAFEAHCQVVGPARAMRDALDPVDGLSFAGGEPARGAASIYAAHGGDHPAGTLRWVPSEVFTSQGGDMGAVWGHFRFTPPGHPQAMVTGKYVTVWRRNVQGVWKGIIDIGAPD